MAEPSFPCPMPSDIPVEWVRPESAKKTEKKGEEFILYTSVKGKEEKLYLSFPEEGGIRLRTDRSGVFNPKGNKKITYNGDTMTAGDTVVAFSGGSSGFTLDVKNRKGVRVMRITDKQIAFGYQGDTLKKVRFECAISKDEVLYGTGERFNSLNQVGNRLVLWNVDTGYHGDKGTDRSWAYKNVPILHSTRGYTMFFNSTYSCTADIGKTDAEKYSLDFNGPKFDMYIWTGSAQKNIQDYTALTGRPFLPPKWAFSYWAGNALTVWESSGRGKHLDMLANMMQKYDELGTIPAAIYGESAPSADPKCYTLLNKYGSRMLMWNYPNNGFQDITGWKEYPYSKTPPIVKYLNGSKHNQNFLDYTHPNALDYNTTHFKKYWEWGLRGGMIDFGELIREDMLFANGMTGDEMHNFYSYDYAKTYYDAWSAGLGNDFITFQRSACAGSQAFAANFSGDQASSWAGLKEQLLGILSLSSCGFSAWGGDMGGFLGMPSPELYTRWTQFAAFSPLMRAHGTAVRDPWYFGDKAVDNFVNSYWMRENLVDTLYSAAIRANKTGTTMVQAMPVAFPGNAALAGNESQYLFCDDLLVSPVTSAGVYYQNMRLPAGNWYDLRTGEKVSGGGTVNADAPIDWIPVYLRQGTVTPIQLAADTLRMSDSMRDENAVPAWLVSPADSTRTSTQWFDADSSNTYQNKRLKGGFVITASKADSRPVMFANGVAATRVVVDGHPLDKAETREDILNGAGFYVDGAGQTLIRIDADSWKTIEIYGGLGEDYTKEATITDSKGSEEVSSLLDDDVTSVFGIPADSGYSLTLDLKEVRPVSQVLMKWLPNSGADSYLVEASTDNENWELFGKVENGSGGVDVMKADTSLQARYIRVSDLKADSGNKMILYAVAAQGNSAQSGSIDDESDPGDGDNVPDNSQTGDEDTDGDASEEPDDVNEEGDEGRMVTKKRLKKKTGSEESAFPWWIPISGGAVLVAAGGVTAFLLIKRKKKEEHK